MLSIAVSLLLLILFTFVTRCTGAIVLTIARSSIIWASMGSWADRWLWYSRVDSTRDGSRIVSTVLLIVSVCVPTVSMSWTRQRQGLIWTYGLAGVLNYLLACVLSLLSQRTLQVTSILICKWIWSSVVTCIFHAIDRIAPRRYYDML